MDGREVELVDRVSRRAPVPHRNLDSFFWIFLSER